MIKSIKTIRYMRYSFIVLLFSIVTNVSAYTMPAGIPESNIDFTQDAPSRPSDWSIEVPGYYYIDFVNGSYSPTFGSETKPRKYIPNSLPAGSYIEIAGDYTKGMGIGNIHNIFSEGTDEAWVANKAGPVWVTQSKKDGGSFSTARVLFWGTNFYVTDIDFKNGSVPQIGSSSNGYPASNIVLRNADISGPVAIAGYSQTSAVNGLVLYNNNIHDAGTPEATNESDIRVMNVAGHSSNVWILNNKMHTASGGLQVHAGGNNGHTTKNIYVGGNEVYNIIQSGMWVKEGKNVIFSSNYVHDIYPTLTSPGKGIGSQYEPDGLWIINNHIEGVEYGIRVTSNDTLNLKIPFEATFHIIGNIIHNVEASQSKTVIDWIGGSNIWQSAAINIVGGHKVYAYNNLIYDAPNGITIANRIKAEIKNNIIFDMTKQQNEGSHGRYVWSELTGLSNNIDMSNNYFDNNMQIDMHKGTVQQTYYSESDLITAGSLNNIKGVKLLTGTDIKEILNTKSTSGFDLSTVEDLGVNGVIGTLYKSNFGTSIENNTDILGETRYQGKAIDIGPFEQLGSNYEPDMSPPETPIIIDVIQIN